MVFTSGPERHYMQQEKLFHVTMINVLTSREQKKVEDQG